MMFICVNWDTPGNQRWCPTWDHVLQATNRDFQGSTDKVTREGKKKMAGYLKLQRDFSSTQNPITMSINQSPQEYRTSVGAMSRDSFICY